MSLLKSIVIGLFMIISSHVCDCERMQQTCLHITRNLSDPCNFFVSRNFTTYHSRLVKFARKKTFDTFQNGFDSEKCTILPGAQNVAWEWKQVMEGAGIGADPGVVVVSVEPCKAIARIPSDKFVSREEDADARLAHTNKAIRTALESIEPRLPQIGELIKETEEDHCSKEQRRKFPQPTLEEFWSHLEKQAESK